MQYTDNRSEMQVVKEEPQSTYDAPVIQLPDLSKHLNGVDNILFHEELTWRQRVLLFLITKLTFNEKKCCMAMNPFLGRTMKISSSQVDRMMTVLRKKGYIRTGKKEFNPTTGVCTSRETYITKRTFSLLPRPPKKVNSYTPKKGVSNTPKGVRSSVSKIRNSKTSKFGTDL